MSDSKNFPNLNPAMTVSPMAGGTAISHPSFQPSIDAVLYGRGTDYIRNDPDGKHMRLDAHTVIK
ncbi:MAG: hypothetical protein Q9193_001514 [Seirophora villosa]